MGSDHFLFKQMRKVVCRLYFAGRASDEACLFCRDKEKCYRLVDETIEFSEQLKRPSSRQAVEDKQDTNGAEAPDVKGEDM